MTDELWIPGKTAMFFIGGAVGTAVAVAIGFFALMALDENAQAAVPRFVTTVPTPGAVVGVPATFVDTVDTELTVIGIEFAYEPEDYVVGATDFELVLENAGRVIHNIEIEGITDLGIAANPGRSDSAKIRLQPGTYTIFCSIAGHREAGMEGTLTVEG